MKKILSLSILACLAACNQKNEPIELSLEASTAINDAKEAKKEALAIEENTQELEELMELDAAGLEKLVAEPKDNKVHVINFFATWCGPCIREMPHFVDVMTKDAGSKLDFSFVNFNDDPNAWFTDVRDFAIKNGIQKQMRYLNSNQNPKAFAQLVSDNWTGESIPFTLILYKNKRLEFEVSLEKQELIDAIEKIQK